MKNKEEKLEEKKSQKPEKTKFSSLLAFVSYVGIGCIAVALLLTLILKGDSNLSNAFSLVGQVIAYVISIVVAFYWVKDHKHIAWIICYVIFVVTIVVLFILNIR